MFAVDFLMRILLRGGLRALQGFLSFDCESLQLHIPKLFPERRARQGSGLSKTRLENSREIAMVFNSCIGFSK